MKELRTEIQIMSMNNGVLEKNKKKAVDKCSTTKLTYGGELLNCY